MMKETRPAKMGPPIQLRNENNMQMAIHDWGLCQGEAKATGGEDRATKLCFFCPPPTRYEIRISGWRGHKT
jgi:hypothetical protein